MGLNDLVRFIVEERQALEARLKEAAQGLRFHEITKGIDFDPRDSKYEEFKDGDNFDFQMCQGHFSATISKQKAILISSTYNVELASFYGKDVEHYYSSLVAAIKKAEEDGAFDVPF
jgi:hypothetical protein